MLKKYIDKLLAILFILATIFINSSPILVKAAEIKPSLICIDSPQSEETVYRSVYIGGWALSDSGVKEVNIYVDGQKVGQAAIGGSRPDVDKAYPGYIGGANSGYGYNLDLNTISGGRHQITVQAIGNDGSKAEASRYINVKKLESRIVIDAPAPEELVHRTVYVRGWALSDSGVKEVNVYVDGQKVGQAAIGGSRPDVDKAYPGYIGGANSGYGYNLDLNTISGGRHQITVQAIGNDGSKAEVSKYINVKKLESRIVIDAPALEESAHRTVYVRGWALSDSGVKEVNVYVDGQKVGQAAIGGSRPDVDKAYPGYIGGANSGYGYNLDLNTISGGRHQITVQAIGNDGSKAEANRYINVTKLQPRMFIDTPVSEATVYKTVYIKGWALHDSGVREINVYVDGQKVGQALTGISRPDVDSVFPGYTNGAKSGFEFNLDSTKFINGRHTLTIVSIGNDESTQTIERILNTLNDVTYYVDYDITFKEFIDKQMKVNPQYYDSSITTGSKWVSATREQVEYYANPKNFLEGNAKYQFLKLNFVYGITAQDLDNLIASVPYTNGRKNILMGKGEVFLRAAQENDINPVYLVSHALLETGNGTSDLAYGILVSQIGKEPDTVIQVEPKVVYNVFGVNAKDSDPIRLGAEYAYQNGWFTIDDAILGGAKFIASSYINNPIYKQDTLYKMRWNPDFPAQHQYASDVRWAYNQTTRIKQMFDNFARFANVAQYFEIPRYKETY
ncbi:Ig-like domain-containing protein [Fonticella tunisiensis]|uniref:Beta-N-acetylglucosaminidase n=1 Tax=Fonticella tunisiensis TaxID=1096341 RepID=A0A4V3ESI0_9CLOT|nr:Ig-like domain-containing protein [Fonticella tunisiensis]TDT52020.1 beta-N-acetylglucosaminidase [Fonticella tunisiensis]